jgi:hypothetical protein
MLREYSRDALAGVRLKELSECHIRLAISNAQLRVLPHRMDAGFERAEVAREIEMLVCGQALVREYQDGIAVERRFYCRLIFKRKRLGQVDIADLGGKGFGDGIEGHQAPGARCSTAQF